MSDSRERGICIAVFTVPAALGLIGGIIWFFSLKAKQLVSRLIEWIQTDWRQRLTSFVGALLAIYTMIEIIQAWNSLINRTVELTDKMPSDRCVPFFYSVQEFIDAYPNSSALYSYDSGGTSRVRLCTNAPDSAVVAKFNATILRQMPTYNGCSMAQVAASCSTVDSSNPSAPVPTCAQLLQTPPLPNGFFYRSTVDIPDTGCAMKFSVQQDLPTCSYSSVYRLQNEASPLVFQVLAVGLAVPTAFLIGNIFTFYRTSQKKKAGEAFTQDDRDAYAFAMEGPIGCIMHTVKFAGGAFPPDGTPPLVRKYFILLQFQTVVEAVLIPVVAVSGCPLCKYWQIVALIVAKAIQFLWTIKKFFEEEKVAAPPPPVAELGSLPPTTSDKYI